MKTLTYEEYQQKVANLKTPEDIANFVKELVAPSMEVMPPEERVTVPRKRRKLALLDNPGMKKYEIAENDTEEKIIALYAKGLTTRDIANYLKELYGIEVSQSMISSITDKVYPLIKEWQARPLSSTYTFLYLDGLHFKVRDAGRIVSKCAYIALGVNEQGYKEVIGIWVGDTESAKFWMGVLNELKNRGVENILIACIDGLRGFPEAIKAIFPAAEIQHCIVHQVRHTIKFLPHKDREQFCNDLKTVYGAPTEEAGRDALEKVKGRYTVWKMKSGTPTPVYVDSLPKAVRESLA